MEEVDSIIIQFLIQLEVHLPDDITNVCSLPVETIIEAASRCLTTINPSLKLPAVLPSGISHRIEVAAQLASACKDLGYKNDVGYQTFLYHNETELRQVFMFLIEHLPSEGAKSLDTNILINNKSLLLRNIGMKISEELSTMWIPPCCNPQNEQSSSDRIPPTNFLSDAITESDIEEEELIQELLKASLINKQKQYVLMEGKEQNLEPQRHAITETLIELKENAIILHQKLHFLESERNIMDEQYQQVYKSLLKAEAKLKKVQNILISNGIDDIDKLKASDDILEKVKTDIGTLHGKSEEWTSRNLEIKMQLDKLRSSHSLLESEKSRYRRTLISLKDSAKAIKDEYTNKELLKNDLKMKYDKLKGGSKRFVYTKRILEIIANVDKQNLEIKKILDDTRQLQKEINSLEGQLDRCFSIADETLFGDAKKDDQAKKAYKLLALLHSECNTIVSLVNDSGTLAREIIDLEDNIKAEKAKRTEDTLEKIELDLKTMKEESKIAV